MKQTFAQSEYKKPVLKTHGTLEEMTMGGQVPAGSGGCSPGTVPSEFFPDECVVLPD